MRTNINGDPYRSVPVPREPAGKSVADGSPPHLEVSLGHRLNESDVAGTLSGTPMAC